MSVSLEDLLKIWQDKKIYFEQQLAITDSVTKKFELKTLILECDKEIARIEQEIARRQSQPQQPTKTSPFPEPPGSSYDPYWYIKRENEEKRAINKLNSNVPVVAIYGPPRFGKSTLLEYLLEQIQIDKPLDYYTITRIDVTKFYKANRQSLKSLLKELTEDLVLSVKGEKEWISESQISSNPRTNIEKLMNTYILPKSGQKLLLVIEQTDVMANWQAKDSFFSMLRSWLQKQDHWKKLGVLLTLSIPTTRLIEDYNQSLFTFCETIYLEDFGENQVLELAKKYGLDNWSETQIKQTMGFVGGHPFLLKSIMYQAKEFNETLDELLDPYHNIFQEHFNFFDSILEKDTTLKEQLKLFKKGEIKAKSKCKPDICNRLVDLGLLKLDRNEYSLSRRIYERLID